MRPPHRPTGIALRGLLAVLGGCLPWMAPGAPAVAPAPVAGWTAAAASGDVAVLDFVNAYGVVYLANDRGRSPAATDLGARYARVRVGGDVGAAGDPCRYSGDGAAFALDPGTELLTVAGYDPRFRLAARRGNAIVLYEAWCSRDAAVGADLFDIEGGVEAAEILSAVDGRTVAAAVDDPAVLGPAVEALLAAPVLRGEAAGAGAAAGPHAFLSFRLGDGTATLRRPFWPGTGLLGGGSALVLPAGLGRAVEAALGRPTAPPTPWGAGPTPTGRRTPSWRSSWRSSGTRASGAGPRGRSTATGSATGRRARPTSGSGGGRGAGGVSLGVGSGLRHAG